MQYGCFFDSLFVCYIYQYFLGFFRKTSSLVFVRSRARKSMRTQPSILLSFFRTRHGNTKRETHGVSFKLFSHSIKMKRLSSDLVLFTLVKVFEENIRWAIVYHFFGLVELLYEKGTERVLFNVFFRLYKHEKPSSFLSLDSLNKHRKTHMGPNHSFLGFVKHTLRDSSEG
jgi:hypothetical protein